MRNFFLTAVLMLASALTAAPAWAAFREPSTIKSPAGQGPGAIVVLVLAALIVGISMMTPRRTHQD